MALTTVSPNSTLVIAFDNNGIQSAISSLIMPRVMSTIDRQLRPVRNLISSISLGRRFGKG